MNHWGRFSNRPKDEGRRALILRLRWRRLSKWVAEDSSVYRQRRICSKLSILLQLHFNWIWSSSEHFEGRYSTLHSVELESGYFENDFLFFSSTLQVHPRSSFNFPSSIHLITPNLKRSCCEKSGFCQDIFHSGYSEDHCRRSSLNPRRSLNHIRLSSWVDGSRKWLSFICWEVLCIWRIFS